MSQNSHDDYELLRLVDQAVEDRQPTGHPVIDRLNTFIPQPDAARCAALEAVLLARLSRSEQEMTPMHDIESESKSKGRPQRFLLLRLVAAVLGLQVFVGLAVIAVQDVTSERGAVVSTVRDEFSPDRYVTATAIARRQRAALSDLTLTAEHVQPEGIAEAASLFYTGDELTATAIVFSFTQEALDLTATAGGLSMPAVTETPVPLSATPAPQVSTLDIPAARLLGYNQTVNIKQGMRLVLFVELPFSVSTAQVSTPPPLRSETSFVATSARVMVVTDDTIIVEVAPDEYPILRWFVESTGMQLLYMASP